MMQRDVAISVDDRGGFDYSIKDLSRVLTPALAIYAANVEHNIETTIALLGNDPGRWRPHVKTSKLGCVMRMFTDHGVTAVKCATTLEMLTACESGARDILLAYPAIGPTAGRALEIALAYPEIAISVLVDSPMQLSQWAGTGVGVFIDIDPGMKRTGVPQENFEEILSVARQIREFGIPFRGLHYYDGHLIDASIDARTKQAHAGYDHLLKIVGLLNSGGMPVEEVITAGTPAFPCALTYRPFSAASFKHRVSPGTIVYGDLTSQASLPVSFGYRFAALVLSRVISFAESDHFTCDAGHKAVSVDAGVPNCSVFGFDGLMPLRPSEEHLPVSVGAGSRMPEIGEVLYLIPKHVCPTVNNFSHALMIRDGKIIGEEKVSARGREAPSWFPVKRQGG
jgi:D-serine deaminase-like pyridoxal phosphate-dependent protein